jgi:hypothetical protein
MQNEKHALITERPSLGQAALELRATPELHFLRTSPRRKAFIFPWARKKEN